MQRLNKTITLTGAFGEEYEFELYSFEDFEDLSDNMTEKRGAIYLFTNRHIEQGEYHHTRIYLGETGDVSTRYKNHHKERCIMNHEANCIGFYWVEGDEEERKAIEDDILDTYNFPCNEMNN